MLPQPWVTALAVLSTVSSIPTRFSFEIPTFFKNNFTPIKAGIPLVRKGLQREKIREKTGYRGGVRKE